MLDDDEELAEDEEEILVYVEFDGSVAGNTFSNEKLHLDMIGLDKEHPIMQVNGKFYEGTYQDAVGTYMFFEKDKNPPVDDPVFDAIPSLKYCAKTRKVLKMHRIFVEPKAEMLGDSNDADFLPNMETIRKAGVPPRYQEAALKSWETMRYNRMDALNRYLEKQRIREEKRAQGIEPDSESDDDNPFAMYKPDGEKQNMKRLEDDLNITEEYPYLMAAEEGGENSRDNEEIGQDYQTLTVIDPGPSTSKASQPWSSPSAPEQHDSDSDSDENYRTNLPNVASKHRATVKVAKKGKLLKKALKKKPNKKGKQMRKSKEAEDLDWEEANEINEAQAAELLSKDLESLLEADSTVSESAANDSIELPENTGDNAPDKPEELESIITKRKLEKQQKREEKMRIMSEKFKKAAEESKLTAQQCPEGGV